VSVVRRLEGGVIMVGEEGEAVEIIWLQLIDVMMVKFGMRVLVLFLLFRVQEMVIVVRALLVLLPSVFVIILQWWVAKLLMLMLRIIL
jgi:hypothetical protein